MKKPKNQKAEVLYELIKRKSINRMQIMQECGILNVTAIISILRLDYNLPIKTTDIAAINKHGRAVQYAHWSLTDKVMGKEIYEIINK